MGLFSLEDFVSHLVSLCFEVSFVFGSRFYLNRDDLGDDESVARQSRTFEGVVGHECHARDPELV